MMKLDGCGAGPRRRRQCLGSLVLLWCSFMASIFLGAAVTISATTSTTTTTSGSSSSRQQKSEKQVKLKVTLKQESLERVPSCQHTFSQVELTNTHSTDSITINSIQATPEETFLIRYDPTKQQSDAGSEEEESASYNTGSWDQRSIPQQVHVSRLPDNSGGNGFTLGPGESAVVPITFLPRYPCTLGGDRNNGLEDYYTPYQVAYSSSWDPDDENFSLAMPDPPKLFKYVSGTARADWEQLVRQMPPQERSNWKQQLQQHYSDNDTSDLPPEFRDLLFDTSSDPGQSPSSEEWIFEVQTTLIFDTSRGPMQLPVEASSLRQNAYGLPDVIYFDQDDEGSIDGVSDANNHQSDKKTGHRGGTRDEDIEDGETSKSSQQGATGKKTTGVLWLDTDLEDDGEESPEEDEDESPMTYRDCYNVIMSNPSLTEDLEVVEVFLSRPDRMNLQLQGELRAPSSSIRQWWNVPRRNNTDGDDAEPKHQHGSLLLRPGEQRYVVTVCTSRSSTPATMPDSKAANDWLYGDDGSEADYPLSLDGPQSSIVARAQRAAARAAKLAAAAKYSLGFLQIRTHKGETLFVALEKDRKQCKTGIPASDGGFRDSDDATSELTPQAAPAALDFDRKQQAYPPSYHHALYKTQELPTAEVAAKMEKPVAVTAPQTPIMTSVLTSVPPRLDFSLLSSSSPTVVSYVAIENPKGYPLKIMRSGVAVEIEDDVDPDQPNPEELGLHMSVKIQNPHLEPEARTEESLMITCSINWERFQAHKLETLFFHGNAILRATAHIDFNYHQWIRNLVNTNAKRQHGKILIKNDYADESSSSSEDKKQTEFVLEIPLTVSMVEGKIGIMIHRTSHPFPHLWAVKSWKEGLGSVSSIFYPQRTFDIRAELDSNDGPVSEPIFTSSGIDHKLRIFSNIHIPSRVSNDEDYQPQLLQIDTAMVHSIEDVEGVSESENTEKSKEEDVCQRFSISIGPPPEDNFPFEGFNDVGLVHIKYRFPAPENGDEDSEFDETIEYNSIPAFPEHCYLTLTTKPYTELHRIPLIVYPGHTDITATQSPSLVNQSNTNETTNGKYKKKNQRRKNQKNVKFESREDYIDGHAVVGFDGLLQWLRATAEGSFLKRFLQRIESDQWDWGWNRRGQHNEEKLLGQYVTNLCRKSLNVRNAHLRPVLLKVGAIKHGTMESASFYMTNHNPIPLLVSIDVGEVEGMSISLARVPTRGRGDGNNILDHFPKKKNFMSGHMGPYSHLVPDGDFRGHPIAGLRKFLQNTDIAQQFFSAFRYRDAIARSPSAVERQPLLNTLYKKYAFGEFHRDPLPMRFGQDGWSQCRGRKDPSEPSQYYDFNSTSSDDSLEDLFDDDYIEHIKAGKIQPGPLMLSDDPTVSKRLKVCWDKDAEPMNYPSDGTYIIVPPGAVARFDLKVNAPPRSMLKEDITRFLSTGLVLSTDHGEILPILVTFEALLGELDVVPANESKSSYAGEDREADRGSKKKKKKTGTLQKEALENITLIQVPPSLFQDKSQEVSTRDSTKHAFAEPNKVASRDLASEDTIGMLWSNTSTMEEVPLSVKSSFSRDVRLLEVSSCNPWFNVNLERSSGSLPVLQQQPTGSEGGSYIGTISSRINCETGSNLTSVREYPSFYQCALNWLANRATIQPRGCGLSPAAHKRKKIDDAGLVQIAEHSGIKRAVKAFEKALLVSSFAYEDSKIIANSSSDIANPNQSTKLHRETDGFVAPLVLDVFAEAWDAWRVVAGFGMRVLSSTLKATIEYDSMKGVPTGQTFVQNLSVPMRDMAVKTVLSTPILFDWQRAQEKNNIPYAVTTEDEDGPSVVEVSPTLVADTRAVILPLRNPTSVPIRVRLAAAAPRATANGDSNTSETRKGALKAKFAVDDEIRNAFIEYGVSPYVQSSKLNSSTQHYHAGMEAEQVWWDGAGGYYIADDYGDLVRSHHNVRIMAGAGAHVSLVNPSLHSNVALIAGCGARCGVRDDKHGSQASKDEDSSEDFKLTSPIGASAAAGVTLAGRMRSNLPQVNVRVKDEPSFSAGAATPGGHGPGAFAIPYSALDEIIIPPYGEAEVGPILFRPPGRYSMHGCQTHSESRAVSMPGAAKKSKACSSNLYQSMIFLENSLTGLERVALRGKALWERVIFIDPPPLNPIFDEDYGDIELRNGRSTLVFPGTRAAAGSRDERRHYFPESSVPGSVVKEVLVYNEGDTTIDFAGVYFSDSARLHRKQSTYLASSEVDDPCSYKQFRLMNCWEDGKGAIKSSGEENGIFRNVKHGFRLEPGRNVSLFIEHFPDCSRPQEFIAMNLERRRGNKVSDETAQVGWLAYSRTEGWPRRQKNSFRKRKFDLLVGYEMSETELKACAPVRRWSYNMRGARCSAANKCNSWWVAGFGGTLIRLSWSLLGFVSTVVFLSASSAIVYTGFNIRKQSSVRFSSALAARKKAGGEGGNNEKPVAQPTSGRGNWGAAFRCLARADPSSSDLQTLGREQIRHVVLGRYRTMGVLSPQCFNANGVFIRERGSYANTSPSRQIAGKEGGNVGGNERIRTLSDAMYRNFSTHQDSHMRAGLPCGLAWRAAAARGLTIPDISKKPPFTLKTPELLLNRVTGAGGSVAHSDETSDIAQHELAGHESSEDSEQDEDSSEEQYTEDGDEEESEELQTSFQSEPSEEQSPETPDALSEEQSPDTPDALSEDQSPDIPEAISEDRGAGITTEKDVVDEIMESEPKKVSQTVKSKPQVDEVGSKQGSVSSQDAPAKGGSENAAKNKEEPRKPKTPAKPSEAPSSKTAQESNKPNAQKSRPEKKNDGKANRDTTEAKAEKRGRQKAKGITPARTTSGESSACDSNIHSPGQKQSQGKDTKAKKSDPKTPRQPKGKAGDTDKGKQPESKANQPRDKNKAKVSPGDTKVTKGADSEEGKGPKRKGKKGEKRENTSASGTKQPKDDSGKKVPADVKAKSSAQEKKQKGKKGKSGKKGSPSQQKASKDEQPQTTAQQSAEKTETVLRPPPGLAPPPGFGQNSAAATQPGALPHTSFDAQLLPPSAFLSDSSVLGSPSSTLGTPSRGTSAFSGLSPSLLSGESPGLPGSGIGTPLRGGLSGLGSSAQQQASGEALLASVTSTPIAAGEIDVSSQANNSMAGFDVMDFLDSILNEGNNAPQAASPQPPQSPFLTASATAAPPLSSDPWATERKSSRASAYGIEIDDAAGGGKGQNIPAGERDDSSGMSMPLLSTAAILYSDRGDQESRDGDEDDEDDNGDSFYASLLGGHKQNNQDEDDNYSGH